MTNEFAIKVLTELRGYGDKFANIGFDRKEALDMAIKALEQCEVWENSQSQIVAPKGTFERIFNETKKESEELPSVTPSRPKGKWIQKTGSRALWCSVCEDCISEEIPYAFDYCPNCGAKMEGDEE